MQKWGTSMGFEPLEEQNMIKAQITPDFQLAGH